MALAVILVTILFALGGLVGSIAAMALVPKLPLLDDGPAKVPIPFWVPVGIAAALGTLLVLRGAPIGVIGYAAVAMVPLSAAFYTDLHTGLVPDYFTVVPLALVIVVALFLHQWAVPIAALIAFAPFALAALFSRGRGMGWGDAKLAAFGGALLGILPALLAFGIASFVATAVSAVRYRAQSQPISFAPYLVMAVVVTLAVTA